MWICFMWGWKQDYRAWSVGKGWPCSRNSKRTIRKCLRKSNTKHPENISKPSRRAIEGISKESKGIGIKKKDYIMLVWRKTKKTSRSMAMPAASMREYAFWLMKASFPRPHHLLSALSQAIPACFYITNTLYPQLASSSCIRVSRFCRCQTLFCSSAFRWLA